jgi:DNA-binding response OmpR family regulator
VPATIMLIEDDEAVRRLVELVLKQEGYTVSSFANAEEALEAVESERPNLFLIDLMLPDMTGLELAKRFRARKDLDKVPIIVLTAKDQMVDRYESFAVGADDFMTKPFDPMELLMRIRSYLRLASPQSKIAPVQDIELHGLKLEPAKYMATLDGREIHLTKLETAVLHHLMSHPGHIFPADDLAGQVLAKEGSERGRTVDAAHAHIRNLRHKIESDASQPKLILTMGRRGYYFLS